VAPSAFAPACAAPPPYGALLAPPADSGLALATWGSPSGSGPGLVGPVPRGSLAAAGLALVGGLAPANPSPVAAAAGPETQLGASASPGPVIRCTASWFVPTPLEPALAGAAAPLAPGDAPAAPGSVGPLPSMTSSVGRGRPSATPSHRSWTGRAASPAVGMPAWWVPLVPLAHPGPSGQFLLARRLAQRPWSAVAPSGTSGGSRIPPIPSKGAAPARPGLPGSRVEARPG